MGINNEKNVLVAAIGLSLGAASLSAQAALVTGTLLTIEPGVQTMITVPDANGDPVLVRGPFQGASFFMGAARTPINPGSDGGIRIGITQLGAGSHGGPPNGTESAPIDAPWGFFSNTGFHFTTSPITVIDGDVNNDGGFTQTLDLSGWSVSWNSIPLIALPGVATITCSLADCAVGSDYSLNFATNIPPSPLHNFGGVGYRLALAGTVSTVPVPAAAWLFGSGLLGLAGFARRNKESG